MGADAIRGAETPSLDSRNHTLQPSDPSRKAGREARNAGDVTAHARPPRTCRCNSNEVSAWWQRASCMGAMPPPDRGHPPEGCALARKLGVGGVYGGGQATLRPLFRESCGAPPACGAHLQTSDFSVRSTDPAPQADLERIFPPVSLSLLQPQVGGGHASTQGLADADSEREMNHVVKSITYGDLWGKGAHPGEKKAHGPPSWLLTAYEGLAHFH